jgi:hypothetical protein
VNGVRVDVGAIVPLAGFEGEAVPIGVVAVLEGLTLVVEDLTLVLEGLTLVLEDLILDVEGLTPDVVEPAAVVGMGAIGERLGTGAGVGIVV